MVKMKRDMVAVSMVAVFIASMFVGGYFGNGLAGAATSNLSMAATIQPSMTVTISDASKTLNIIPSSEGTFGSTSITVGAHSNGSIGYTLTMTPSNSSLVGIFGAIPTLSSASNCNGGTACNSSNFPVGHWGIAVGNAVYGPATTTGLATVANTNTSVFNSTYTINLGVNLDLSTPMDEYTTTLNFTVTPEIRTYAITYTYDSGIADIAVKDISGNIITPTSTASGSKTYDLYYANDYMVAPTYVDEYESNNVSIAAGAGIINSDTYMYTVGAGSGTVAVTSKTRMQNMDSSLCTTTPMAVYDSRDGQTYIVAKLADDKCWMLENLNLAGGTALSADDTDVTSEYISGFTAQGRLTKEGNTIVLPASATKNSGDNNLTDSSQFSNNSYAYVFNSGNKTNCGANGQNTPCYSYYSWIAATLGGKQGDGATAETRNGYNAAASICPKGWRLPTSTTSNANAVASPNWKTGDWYALVTAYGVSLENESAINSWDAGRNFYNNAGPGTTPNFLFAGRCDSGSLSTGGGNGRYWSATATSSGMAYGLCSSLMSVGSACSQIRTYGHSVRCILNN